MGIYAEYTTFVPNNKYIALLCNINDIQTTSLIAWLAPIDEPRCIVAIRRIHMVGCVHVLFSHS